MRVFIIVLSLFSMLCIGVISISKSHAETVAQDRVVLEKQAAGLENSGNLSETGKCVLSNGYCYSVFVREGIAYYGDGEFFTITDVNDPSSPVILSSFILTGNIINRIIIFGDYAFIANHVGGVWILDISNPYEPFAVWTCEGSAMDIAISGDFAYVADYHGGLKILDISDPFKTSEIGCYDEKTSPMGVYIAGKYCYVSYCFYGLMVLDISDPSDPVKIGNIDTEGSANGVFIRGDFAYVAEGDNGLLIFDISVPYDPVEAGIYTVGGASKVSVFDNYAYVANGDYGLRIVDITDPFDPFEADVFETGGYVQDVFVTENDIYVADWKGGVSIVKYENPVTNISEKNTLNGVVYDFGNYPNPFNAVTNISYSINSTNRVVLSIFNIAGQMVNILVNETQNPGKHSATWYGIDGNGSSVPSGLYLYRLQVGESSKSNKLLLLK